MSPEEIMVLSGFNKVYLICGLPIVERILRSNFPFLDDLVSIYTSLKIPDILNLSWSSK